MHQQKYIGELHERFDMSNCNTITNPSEINAKFDEFSEEENVEATKVNQMVGSLRYLRNSRPDIYIADLIQRSNSLSLHN